MAYGHYTIPIQQVFGGSPVLPALDTDNNLIIVVSADYAFWEEILAGLVIAMDTTLDEQPAASRQIWLRGQASSRFKTEVAALGWTVRENIKLRERIVEKFVRPAKEQPDNE